MSVREEIYLSSDASIGELASRVTGALGGRLTSVDDTNWVVVDTDYLVPGAHGQFGGPILREQPEWPHHPPGEFEATDAYQVVYRLWQALGNRVQGEPAVDVERAAAAAVFERVAPALAIPMLHVRNDDQLVAAYRPELGLHRFPAGTSVYGDDAPAWGEWVLPSPAEARSE